MLPYQISQSTSLIIIQINEVFWFRDDLIRIELDNENTFEQTLKMTKDNGMDGKTIISTRDCKMACQKHGEHQVGHEKKVIFGRQWALKDVGIWNP
jgi:hypothetical protein